MKSRLTFTALLLLVASPLLAQNFSVGMKGVQTFFIRDERGRNQAIFYSKAPLEDITGVSTGLDGTIELDPSNVVKTIKAELSVDITTLKTGIDMRDSHLRSESWLDAEKYPRVTFVLKSLKNAKTVGGISVTAMAIGDLTLHGVTREVKVPVTLKYLVESEQTRTRAPGDLLSLRAAGKVKLSDYGVTNKIIGSKVENEIGFEFNAVASDAFKPK